MFRFAPSMASLAALPVFLPMLVAAVPAADPLVTPAAVLDKRANGANIIGYSLSGTSWRTRSCNNGFFSTVGTIGNCCNDSDCDFITSCAGDYIYYDSGSSSNCGNVCGTGTIFHTAGDQSPLHMFNCQSDWTVTETVSASTTSSPSVVTTTASGSTVTVPNTANNVQSTASSATSTASSVTQTGASASSTNSDSTATSSTLAAASGSSTASSSSSDSNKGSSNSTSHSNAGAIAGGVVGGLAVLAIIAGIVAFLLWKRRKDSNATTPPPPTDPNHQYAPPPMQDNNAWNQQQNGYPYGAPPPAGAGGVYNQDYKVPLANGGYMDQPQPQMLGNHPSPPPAQPGPQELYSGPVQSPVEMPTQQGGYAQQPGGYAAFPPPGRSAVRSDGQPVHY